MEILCKHNNRPDICEQCYLLKNCSPMPWRIDKDNADGVEILDAQGNLVYHEDYGCFPNEMSSSLKDEIIKNLRANARLFVLMSEGKI